MQVAIILVFIVIVLGAYTRLSNAGLGCPDWPGCYGEFLVPDIAGYEYERPLEHIKAWKELVHRYAGALLGIVVIFLFIFAIFSKTVKHQSTILLFILLCLVVFQGMLGMWTVTKLVHPVIVSMHLIGGFASAALLFWLLLNQTKPVYVEKKIPISCKLILFTSFFVLIFQIFLGGWTSANYAALSCGSFFPTCLGKWWFSGVNLADIFFFGEFGVNYEFGVLSNDNRSVIQIIHRIGALFTAFVLIGLVVSFRKFLVFNLFLITTLFLLVLQIVLGIFNVVLSLPIFVAVSHNVVALCLLLNIIWLIHRVYKSSSLKNDV